MTNYQVYAYDAAAYICDNYPDVDADASFMDFVERVSDYGQCECCRTFNVNKPLYDIDSDGEYRNVGFFCKQCIDGIEQYFNREMYEIISEAEDAHASAVFSYKQAIGF